MPLTAAVVEDDPFTRTMLVATLRSQGVDVVIDTGVPAEALELARLRRPRVAVLDLHLGAGPTGIELAHSLRALDRHIALVVLTSFDDPRLLSTRLPELPRGARYVTKREVGSVEVLIRTLKDAVDATGSDDVAGLPSSLGEEVTVELVACTAPMSMGVSGGPVPTSVPSGGGPVPVWPLGLLALAGGLALRRGSRSGRSAWRAG